jgi:hypothetical protein
MADRWVVLLVEAVNEGTSDHRVYGPFTKYGAAVMFASKLEARANRYSGLEDAWEAEASVMVRECRGSGVRDAYREIDEMYGVDRG